MGKSVYSVAARVSARAELQFENHPWMQPLSARPCVTGEECDVVMLEWGFIRRTTWEHFRVYQGPHGSFVPFESLEQVHFFINGN